MHFLMNSSYYFLTVLDVHSCLRRLSFELSSIWREPPFTDLSIYDLVCSIVNGI